MAKSPDCSGIYWFRTGDFFLALTADILQTGCPQVAPNMWQGWYSLHYGSIWLKKKKTFFLCIARTETKVKANRCLCINQNLASTFKNMNPSIVYHNTTYKIYNNLDLSAGQPYIYLGWSDTNMSISWYLYQLCIREIVSWFKEE